MKITLLSRIAIVATFVAGVAGVASAAGPDHSTPGTPGTAGCKGQTVAYLAQAAKNGLLPDAFHGIGGVGRAVDLSSAQIMTVVDAFCAAP